MSRLEDQAKPILTPLILGTQLPTDPFVPVLQNVTLTPAAQRIVATWSLKTAVTFDLAHSKPKLTKAVASRFFTDRRPPDDCDMMIAAYGGPDIRFAGRVYDSKVFLSNFFTKHGVFVSSSNPVEQPARLVSLQVFRLLVQILLFDGMGFRLRTSSDLDLRVHHIWPPRLDAVTWPPNGQNIRDGREMVAFVQREAHFQQRN